MAQAIMDRWPQWFGRKGMRTNEQLRFMLDLAQVLAAPAPDTVSATGLDRQDGGTV